MKWFKGIKGCDLTQLETNWFWKEKEISLVEYKMLTDFKKFLSAAFFYLGLPRPTKRQFNLAQYLQSPHTNKKIVLSYRGAGKSYIACMLVLWFLYINPDERILIVSATEQKAAENTTFIKNLIYIFKEISFLKAGTNKNDGRSSALAFTVGPAPIKQAPSVRAKSSTGALTGSRCSILIFDDLEIPKNSKTFSMREELKQKYVEGTMTLEKEMDNPNIKTIFLGTPQVFDTLYFKLEKEFGFEIRIWPARYPTIEEYNKYYEPYLGLDIKKDLKDHPEYFETGYGLNLNRCRTADSDRYSEDSLIKEELSVGPTNFDLHFQLNSQTSDLKLFKLKYKDLVVVDLDKDKASGYYVWTNIPGNMYTDLPCDGLANDNYFKPIKQSDNYYDYEGCVMHIDPSGMQRQESDETAWTVTKMLNGNVFIVDTGGVPDYSKNSMDQLAEIAKVHKVNQVMIEANYGDGMFTELAKSSFKKIYHVTIKDFKVSGKKETRIISILEPMLNAHKIVTSPECIINDYNNVPMESSNPEQYSLFYQMARINGNKGSIKHDDRLDCLASAVKYWVESVGRNSEDTDQFREQQEYLKNMYDELGITDSSSDLGKFITV